MMEDSKMEHEHKYIKGAKPPGYYGPQLWMCEDCGHTKYGEVDG